MSSGAVPSVGTARASVTSPGAGTNRPSSPAMEPVTVSVDETSDSPASERRVSAHPRDVIGQRRLEGGVSRAGGRRCPVSGRSAAEPGMGRSESAIGQHGRLEGRLGETG